MKYLFRNGITVFAATLIWQLSNFSFNVVGAHELGPEEYGILASAIGLAYLINPLVLAAQTVASRESTTILVDDQGSQIRAIVRYYVTRLGLGSVCFSMLIIAFSEVIASYLKLNSPLLVVIVALVMPTLIMSAVVRGVHQGTRRYGRYSLGTLAEGLTKIAAVAVFLTFIWRAPISGMLALLVSAIAGLTVNILLLRHFPKPRRAARLRNLPIKYSINTFAAYGLMAILFSIDTTTARLTLSAHAAGLYAGISLTGKIVYFATTAIATFVFPIFSAKSDTDDGTGRWLLLSVGMVVGVCCAAILTFSYAPYAVTDTLLGSKYHDIGSDVPLMGIIFGTYALVNLLVTYLLARRQRGLVSVLGLAVLVQIAGFAAFHRSIGDLMAVLACAFGCAAMGGSVLAAVSLVRGNAAIGSARDRSSMAGAASPANVVQAYGPGRHRSEKQALVPTAVTREPTGYGGRRGGRGRHRGGDVLVRIPVGRASPEI